MIGGSGELLDSAEGFVRDGETEQRLEIRYDIQEPCTVRRVFPSGDVDINSPRTAMIWDASRRGVGLIVEDKSISPGCSLLISIEKPDGLSEFQSVVVVNSQPTENNKVRLNTVFGGPLGRIFERSMLLPRLDPTSMKYEMGFDKSNLAGLASLRALQTASLDYVDLCPKCHAVPTVRHGCCRCLSGHVSAARMIHHYACANVDFAENFEYEGQIICNKCRTKKLIVGADFEYLDGPNRCADCFQSNLDLIAIGHCMGCSYRFPLSMAETQEIVGYRVARLDILDLINTA